MSTQGNDGQPDGTPHAVVVPSLLCRNMEDTLDFYSRLGFRLTDQWPDRQAPKWAEVGRDGARIHFYTEPSHGEPDRPALSGTITIAYSDVMALAREVRGRVSFVWGPDTGETGLMEFAVRDPNGYLLAFVEPARR